MFTEKNLSGISDLFDLESVNHVERIRTTSRFNKRSDRSIDGFARVVAGDYCLLASAFKNNPSRWFNRSYTLDGIREKGAYFYESSSYLLRGYPKWRSVTKEMSKEFDVLSDSLREVADSSFFSSHSAQQIVNRQDVLLSK